MLTAKAVETAGYQNADKALKDSQEPIAARLYGIYEKTVAMAKGNAKKSKCAYFTHETKAEDDLDEYTKELLKQFREYAFTQSQIITETLGQDIARYVANDLQKLIEEGAGNDVISRALRKKIEDLTPYKADLIARTETLTSSAQAQDGFVDEIWDEDEDGELWKQWQATNDPSRTRQDHLDMVDNPDNLIPRSQKFKMTSGDLMDYPGDPSGPARQVCQCRCSCSYGPKEIFE
jgi:hypothetical protein